MRSCGAHLKDVWVSGLWLAQKIRNMNRLRRMGNCCRTHAIGSLRKHKGNANQKVTFTDYYIDMSAFTGKYTIREIHTTKLHPGPEWRIFYILYILYIPEDIDDVISHVFTVVCANSLLVKTIFYHSKKSPGLIQFAKGFWVF